MQTTKIINVRVGAAFVHLNETNRVIHAGQFSLPPHSSNIESVAVAIIKALTI